MDRRISWITMFTVAIAIAGARGQHQKLPGRDPAGPVVQAAFYGSGAGLAFDVGLPTSVRHEIYLRVMGGVPHYPYALWLGFAPASRPWANLTFLVAPPLIAIPGMFDAGGAGGMPLPVPSTLGGLNSVALYLQAVSVTPQPPYFLASRGCAVTMTLRTAHALVGR